MFDKFIPFFQGCQSFWVLVRELTSAQQSGLAKMTYQARRI